MWCTQKGGPVTLFSRMYSQKLHPESGYRTLGRTNFLKMQPQSKTQASCGGEAEDSPAKVKHLPIVYP